MGKPTAVVCPRRVCSPAPVQPGTAPTWFGYRTRSSAYPLSCSRAHGVVGASPATWLLLTTFVAIERVSLDAWVCVVPPSVGRSALVFAHVRAASIGSPVTEANCHPFTIGPYLFMHNGCVCACRCRGGRRCANSVHSTWTGCEHLVRCGLCTMTRFLADFAALRLRMLNYMTPTVFKSVVGTSDSEHMYVPSGKGVQLALHCVVDFRHHQPVPCHRCLCSFGVMMSMLERRSGSLTTRLPAEALMVSRKRSRVHATCLLLECRCGE